MKLCIDLAYSACKCKSEYSEFSFPTCPKIPKYGNVAEDGIQVYEFNGKQYVLDADHIPGHVIHERDFNFLLTYAPIFVAHAIYKSDLHLSSITEVRVGIPYEDYLAHKNEMVEVLSDFTVSGVRYQLPIRCIPQGSGAFVEYVATVNPGTKSGFLLDFGFNTVIKIKFENMAARKAGSEQLNHYGLSEAMSYIGNHLKKEFGVEKTKIELNQIFRDRVFTFRGVTYDLSSVCDEAVKEYLEKILRELWDKHSEEFDDVSQLVIAGGGAHYITKSCIPSAYQEMTYIMQNDPEFANVRGMFRVE